MAAAAITAAERLWTGHDSTRALIDDVISIQDDPFARRQLERFKYEFNRADAIRQGTGTAQHSLREIKELPEGRKVLGVNFGPSSYGVSAALHLAGNAYLTALDSLVHRFAKDLEEQLRAADGFYWRAWKDQELLAGLEDDDPCPCDKPDTLWGTCHKWTASLGTTTYTPVTDADLVRFRPFDPDSLQREPPKPEELPPGPDDYPTGPHFDTFSFTLPFSLGLDDTVAYGFSPRGETWADPNDIGHFSERPQIRIRFHREPLNSTSLWLADPSTALRAFFGGRASEDDLAVDLPPIRSYEQWVTLETPGARLTSENPTDRAYAFHRCLGALNAFLMAMDFSVTDQQISTVTTHELGLVVFRGAWTMAGRWKRLGILMMHPEGWPSEPTPISFEKLRPQFDRILGDLISGRPFMLSHLWHRRAQRALRIRGDTSDGVVSLQTAVESMVYDLLRSCLVDEGKSSSEISTAVGTDRAFKSLLTKEFHWRLKGNWDLIGSEPVARYWTKLYELRNRVVHAGYTPGIDEADEALKAYFELREFTNVRLFACCARYPRTLLAKLGANGLDRRGWMTMRMKDVCAAFVQEPRPFYLPWDMAGRPNPSTDLGNRVSPSGR